MVDFPSIGILDCIIGVLVDNLGTQCIDRALGKNRIGDRIPRKGLFTTLLNIFVVAKVLFKLVEVQKLIAIFLCLGFAKSLT